MLQNLRYLTKISKFRLDNLVDLNKCCKTHIYSQRSVPIQPKTSDILLKFCRSAVVSPQEWAAAGAPAPAEKLRPEGSVANLYVLRSRTYDPGRDGMFFHAARLRYTLEKTKREIRENIEHLVPRPFTTNNKESTKHQHSKMIWNPKPNEERGDSERYETELSGPRLHPLPAGVPRRAPRRPLPAGLPGKSATMFSLTSF